MDDDEEYKNLKKEINSMISPREIHFLKSHFSKQIDSKRDLQDIRTASDLFLCLEKRNVLSSDNITSLIKIGAILGRNKINELLELYQKLQDSLNDVCSCGQSLTFVPPPPVFTGVRPIKNQVEYHSDEKIQEQLHLDMAISNVSEHIGEQWAVLARELNLTERDISEIRKLTNDFKVQAFNALLLWKRKAESQVTVAMLEMALNTRLCLRKGLGPHLLSMKKIKI